jgi:two-component system, OmpR family, sensor histidine kinase MtrB
MTLVATGAVGILAFLVALWLTRRIVLPIRQLTAVANRLSAGLLDVQLPGPRSKDEIQDLEGSLERVLAAVSTLMAELGQHTPIAGAADVESAHRLRKDVVPEDRNG